MAKTITAPKYTCLDSDINITCNATSNAIQVRLPKASTNAGKSIRIEKEDSFSNAVTIISQRGDILDDGTRQVETATVVGTVVNAGNATVVLTSANIDESPVTVSVAVKAGDTASIVAGKIREALTMNALIGVAETGAFTISGTGANVVLTSVDYLANDSTLNLSIDNGTCTGLTTAATSTDTTAGSSILILTSGEYATFVSDGTTWAITDFNGVNRAETLSNKTLTTPVLTNPLTLYYIIANGDLVDGDLVYPSGWDEATGRFKVSKASANGTTPSNSAWFVAYGNTQNNQEGIVSLTNVVTGYNTNAATVGDPVYLSETAGAWSLSAPTGAGKTIQQVGVVKVKSVNNGAILFMPGQKNTTDPKIADGGYIADGNGNELIKCTTTANAVNEVTITNAATNNPPSIASTGGDTNIGLTLAGKGTGSVNIGQATTTGIKLVADQAILDSAGNEYIKFSKTTNAVNEITIGNAATSGVPNLTATGGDTDIAIHLRGKGTGAVYLGQSTCQGVLLYDSQPLLDTNANELIKFGATANAVNEITVTNAATNGSPTVSATGSDSNINLTLSGKGTGQVIAGTKVMFTPEGGLAVKLTNKTGGASVKGEVVTVYDSTAIDNAVKKIVVDVPAPIGVFYESGVADGSEAWVVVSGIADVYFTGNTTRGHIARGYLTADGAGYVTGQALADTVPNPLSDDKHFYEIGHVLESRTGAGLAKCVLHFN